LITFLKSLQAWNNRTKQNLADFKVIFIHEVEELDGDILPLQAALQQSNYAMLDDFKVMIISIQETDNYLEIKTGLFYSGLIAGCSCADDPTPMNSQAEFCECLFKIDKESAQVDIQLIQD